MCLFLFVRMARNCTAYKSTAERSALCEASEASKIRRELRSHNIFQPAFDGSSA